MKNQTLLLFSIILLSFGCHTEDPAPLPEGEIEFTQPYFVINNSIEMRLETNSSVDRVFWDFGNGNTSREMVGRSQYLEPGIYEINLTITDTDGNSNVITKEIKVGQYHGYQAILHRVSNEFDGTSGDIQFQVIDSFFNTEVLLASPIFENFQFEDLPLVVEIDIPLGGGGRYIHESPFIRFMETKSESILGMQGASNSYTWLDYEFYVNGFLGQYSIKYRLVLPE